jgi:hypothetical protein
MLLRIWCANSVAALMIADRKLTFTALVRAAHDASEGLGESW